MKVGRGQPCLPTYDFFTADAWACSAIKSLRIYISRHDEGRALSPDHPLLAIRWCEGLLTFTTEVLISRRYDQFTLRAEALTYLMQPHWQQQTASLIRPNETPQSAWPADCLSHDSAKSLLLRPNERTWITEHSGLFRPGRPPGP